MASEGWGLRQLMASDRGCCRLRRFSWCLVLVLPLPSDRRLAHAFQPVRCCHPRASLGLGLPSAACKGRLHLLSQHLACFPLRTGLGRKSVGCIMLLTLNKKEFPVDTNVGRICARWARRRFVPCAPCQLLCKSAAPTCNKRVNGRIRRPNSPLCTTQCTSSTALRRPPKPPPPTPPPTLKPHIRTLRCSAGWAGSRWRRSRRWRTWMTTRQSPRCTPTCTAGKLALGLGPLCCRAGQGTRLASFARAGSGLRSTWERRWRSAGIVPFSLRVAEGELRWTRTCTQPCARDRHTSNVSDGRRSLQHMCSPSPTWLPSAPQAAGVRCGDFGEAHHCKEFWLGDVEICMGRCQLQPPLPVFSGFIAMRRCQRQPSLPFSPALPLTALPFLAPLSSHSFQYELHFQMITLGKVFCNKQQPNW